MQCRRAAALQFATARVSAVRRWANRRVPKFLPAERTLFRHGNGLFEFHRKKFGNAVAAHGDAVEDARAAHGLAVMGNDDELTLLREILYHVPVAAAVRLVEGGVGLVQYQKWRGIHLAD